MASSRIFVKGLPPTISEQDFKKHFSHQSTITDVKLIPHRRIGYVGYKSAEEAVKAVKYFNKSFIRMSRILVELALPISDGSLPISRKARREKDKEMLRTEKAADAISVPSSSSLKRKRNDIDESDPKLKEFLQVMQPKSKLSPWSAETLVEQDTEERPKKMLAMELPEVESDNEYELVPIESRKEKIQLLQAAETSLPAAATMISAEREPNLVNIPKSPPRPTVDPAATDDDWMRSRTNRLLDLVDPADSAVTASTHGKQRLSSIDGPMPRTKNRILAEDEHISKDKVGHEDPLDTSDNTEEAIRASGRLFVRNLPYTATEEDLSRYFETYGLLEEVHLPLDAAGKSKGYVLVQYREPEAAAKAYHNVDGEPFQGRLLHVLPAAAKRENRLDEFAIAKLPLKKQKQIKKKAEAATTTFNWNSLYMNQDAVNSSIADRLGVSKSDLLDPTSADAGVKQAIAETSIIQETKTYFIKNGVDLDAFKKRERGDTTILVKNFPYGTTVNELRRMFEEFGQVLRVLMPPSGTIAIVEFAQAPQARAAFGNLAYRRIKDLVLYLEKAPKNLFTHESSKEAITTRQNTDGADPKLAAADLLEREPDLASGDTSTLFVRNLNFDTTSAHLTEIFAPLDGFMSARVNTKTDPRKPGKILSMGFGFIEFKSKIQAQAGLAAMNGYSLDNHKLVIKASHKGLDAAEERRKEDNSKKTASKRTKIIIKNLPFEASKQDVRKLFGTYGQLRSVRVPKKYDMSARGFAFADFTTAREAENALEALKDTHLLGRRLVLEFAAEETADAEEEIEKMQKKINKQVNKVALQKLTGGGRKKINIEGDENEEG